MCEQYSLWIEPRRRPGTSYQYGWSLGTIPKIARQIAEEVFHERLDMEDFRKLCLSVSIRRGGKVLAIYDGVWNRPFGEEKRMQMYRYIDNFTGKVHHEWAYDLEHLFHDASQRDREPVTVAVRKPEGWIDLD